MHSQRGPSPVVCVRREPHALHRYAKLGLRLFHFHCTNTPAAHVGTRGGRIPSRLHVPEPLAGECIHRGVLLLWCVPSAFRLSSVILSACPEARAPFVRYRSLTLSAVQLLTGAPPVSSTDTMELLSGTAKADNPKPQSRSVTLFCRKMRSRRAR